MKILYINCVCGVGSTGRIVSDLMKQAKDQGHIAKVACSTVEPVKSVAPEDVIKVGSKLDYYLHNLLSRITDHEGLFSKRATRRLIKQIKNYDPDIVHIHNIHGHWINYEILFQYLAEANKKTIWTLHDCWAFTGHCSYFSMLNCDQWKTGCANCPGTNVYPQCYGKGDTKKNYERKKKAFTSVKDITITTPSKWLAKIARESFLSPYPIQAIYNGIDLDKIKRVQSDIRDCYGIRNKKIILAVSNVWSKRKGLDDILKLRLKLDDEYIIIIVGLTKEKTRELPFGCIGVQRTSNLEDLVRLYSAADVFINPSYEETMGLVTVEALACGTPAVVYDRTAVPEVVDQNSGIVVNAGNIDQLFNAVLTVINHSERFMGTRSRSMFFEKKKQYQEVLKLYTTKHRETCVNIDRSISKH